ncbi:hypothetical protein MHYP_G00353940 [Metynnis hypsauchen]
MLATAKEECIIRKLADLRARGPEPLMVSDLDLDAPEGQLKENKVHQQTVKRNKSNMTWRNPRVKSFKLLQGYLAGYLGILTAHRPVVLTNLQKESILQAETDEQNRAVVWVDHHKTDRTVGNAFIALLPLEVDWLKGLIEVSAAHFGGDQCPYVFQFDGKQLYKLNMELKSAWNHVGMQGYIRFGLIRTAIANQAKKHLLAEERRLVCEAMCHDVSTADRFYTTVPDIVEIFCIRDLRVKAMEQEDGLEQDIHSTDNEPGLTATSDSDNE